MNSWKYSIIVPLLVIFAINFNTKTVAQTSGKVLGVTVDQQNILKFAITKDTKDDQLEAITKKLSDKGATVSFSNVKRNSENEIIRIKTKFKYKGTSGNHVLKSSEPISSFEISMNLSNGAISVKKQVVKLSQNFVVETTENDELEQKTETSKKIVLTSKEDSTKQVTRMEDVKVISVEEEEEEEVESNSKLFTDDENTPLVLSDGKEITKEQMDAIDPNTIESIQVLKDETSTKKYGKKGKNGVILVTTKIKTNTGELITANGKTPLYLVDGKEITKTEMGAMNPNAIASISVLKNEKATKIYGKKGEHGVVMITTKKDSMFKTDDGELISIVENQDQKTSIIPKSNNGEMPLYIMDGKEITKTQMEAINPNTIASVFILKDEAATKKYGKKGENGVILITIKKE